MDGAVMAYNFNEEDIRKLLTSIREQFVQKNDAYGNSAHESFSEYGEISYKIRIGDKLRRWARLKDNPSISPGDEKIIDTLKDAICYCFMAAASKLVKVTQGDFPIIDEVTFFGDYTIALMIDSSIHTHKIVANIKTLSATNLTYNDMKQELDLLHYYVLICMLICAYFQECKE